MNSSYHYLKNISLPIEIDITNVFFNTNGEHLFFMNSSSEYYFFHIVNLRTFCQLIQKKSNTSNSSKIFTDINNLTPPPQEHSGILKRIIS